MNNNIKLDSKQYNKDELRELYKIKIEHFISSVRDKSTVNENFDYMTYQKRNITKSISYSI